MRHEVVDLVAAILAMSVRVQRGKQSSAPLYPHAEVQRSTLAAVVHPAAELGVAEPALCLGDSAATDAAQHQLMPDLF